MWWIGALLLSLVVAVVAALRRSPLFTAIGLFFLFFSFLRSLSLIIPPIPAFVLRWYLLLAGVALLLYFSIREETFERFKAPLIALLVEREMRFLRVPVFLLFPLAMAYMAYAYTKPALSPPAESRTIHPEPPVEFSFRGKRIKVLGLENPLRKDRANLARYIAEGKEIYYRNCVFCHGDLWDGKGIFAHGFNPAPLPFRGTDTIAQLPEGYVFWRVSTGGPGLPPNATPWSSAMPVWQDMLSEKEIWKVILYIYDATGNKPRTWE